MNNALQTTTVGASGNQFFGSEPREAMERQSQVLPHDSLCSNTQNTLCGLLKASSGASVSTLFVKENPNKGGNLKNMLWFFKHCNISFSNSGLGTH
ncbi:hypothetical protein P9112_002597 [Eukaryota sp. TZLM1-RC]